MPETKTQCPDRSENENQKEIESNSCEKGILPNGVQTENAEQSNIELYSPNAAGLWSLALSVVFGSWCIWQNYKTIGDEKAEKRSKIWMFSLAAIIVITLFLPDGASRYTTVPLLVIWYFAEQRPQVKYLKDKNIEYRKKPWKKPVCTAIVILLLFFGFAAILSSCSGNAHEDEVIHVTTKILRENSYRILKLDGWNCIKITKEKSLGDKKYSAKAVLRNRFGDKALMDIKYEIVDEAVLVTADLNSFVKLDNN